MAGLEQLRMRQVCCEFSECSLSEASATTLRPGAMQLARQRRDELLSDETDQAGTHAIDPYPVLHREGRIRNGFGAFGSSDPNGPDAEYAIERHPAHASSGSRGYPNS